MLPVSAYCHLAGFFSKGSAEGSGSVGAVGGEGRRALRRAERVRARALARHRSAAFVLNGRDMTAKKWVELGHQLNRAEPEITIHVQELLQEGDLVVARACDPPDGRPRRSSAMSPAARWSRRRACTSSRSATAASSMPGTCGTCSAGSSRQARGRLRGTTSEATKEAYSA